MLPIPGTEGIDNVKNGTLRTVEALSFVGMDRVQWNSIVARRLVSNIPDIQPGKVGRTFDADGLVALEVLNHLLERNVSLETAGVVHDEFRDALRKYPTSERPVAEP